MRCTGARNPLTVDSLSLLSDTKQQTPNYVSSLHIGYVLDNLGVYTLCARRGCALTESVA